jgi:outer membrane protein OmpA-like peptidoglycan-associated protein
MRAIFSLPFRFLLVAAFAVVPGVALAQDEFDDEFDDEFEEPAADDDAEPAQGEDEFSDEFGEDVADAEAEGGGEDAETPEDAEAPADPHSEAAIRERRLRFHNTIQGPTGGLRLVDAIPAARQSFRAQLMSEFFFASDFLNTGDSNDHIGGHLSLSWAVHDLVEVFASIASYANSNNLEEPNLFQVLGDTQIGVKVGAMILPWLGVGGDLTIGLLNTVGDIGVVFGSTSVGLRADLTADLRGLDNPIPLITRFNLQYFFDNSENLISDVETARYDALPDPMERPFEDRHLITRVERYALNINRVDFFNIALGVEAPLEATEDLFINPMLEWTWSIPVNRQGYDCLFIPNPDMPGEPRAGDDGCLDKQGAAAFPMRLSLGVRVLPPVEGFAATAAVDIGLTGTSTFVREVSPTPPYNIMLGISYAYDASDPPVPAPVVQEVERRVEVRVPPPPKGRIVGTVVEQGNNAPVNGAIISFPGRELTALVSSQAGTFTTYELDPGEVQLAITHPEYHDGTCAATIAEAGGDVTLQCELQARPRVGTVRGRVVGTDGAAVMAEVQLRGQVSRTLRSDAAGVFSVADLAPGTYTVSVTADEYLIKTQSFDVRARETTEVQVDLVARPARPLVTVQRRAIQIRRQINFATDSAEILATSNDLMNEIADVIIRNPQIRRIEIQGHTDNQGTADHNLDLSQRRAESVRQWLVDHGVEADRLEARGYGMTRPLVPNITPANRARNRRVQFVITEEQAADAAPAP